MLRPTVTALLLLALCSSAPAAPPRLLWKDQRLRPSSPQGLRVARTALSYLNYRTGSPSALRALSYVTKVSVKTLPGLGRQYFLHFTTKDSQTKENLGTCTASVFYMKKKPKPNVTFSCSKTKDSVEQLHEDLRLYTRISDVRHPSLDQVRALVSLGSSYIEWEKSTEDSGYFLKDVKNVKQQKRDDEWLELTFTVVLGNDAMEPSASCLMRMAWLPNMSAAMKYDCSSEDESSGSADESSGSADGSGEDVDFAPGFFPDLENNF
ncbi:hypothetical protein lerEdw1_008242 [Lerista edwardsae]|nr:hypothetical protein lerEdw1_008242 [Lerista edwardsae]